MSIIMKVGIRLSQKGKQATSENVTHLAEAGDKSGFIASFMVQRYCLI